MITIREIAAIAGVSRSTVSLVLNNSPLVRQETRERVLNVIRATGYVPNSSARSLSLRATRSLGIIVLSDQTRSFDYDFSNPVGLFSLNVMNGILGRLSMTEYSVFIEYYSGNQETQTADGGVHSVQAMPLPQLIRERRIDGAFLVGGYCKDSLVRSCLPAGIPLVTVGVGTNTGLCDAVIADPAEGTYDALMYLRAKGRKRLALLNCPQSFSSAAMRMEAVRRFCRDTGTPEDALGVLSTLRNNGESACEALRTAWNAGLRFDGLVTSNPQSALGAMRFLLGQGVRIPQDVSLVAYEDSALCGYATPPLTAVNIRKEKMGEEAAELMLRRLAEPQMPIQLIAVPSYLVERESV